MTSQATVESVSHFEDAPNPQIRKRIDTSADRGTKAYLDSLLEAIVKSRAVQHPFLQWYRVNRLTPEQERVVFLECFHFFRYLPFYIAAMARNTRDESILREIVMNVFDEVCGTVTHSRLYVAFLEKLGITQDEALAYKPLRVTTRLNDGIRDLYCEPPLESALGALYADETMSAIMVSKLDDGLANQGHDAATRHFWTLHRDVEIGHSNSVFNAIFPHATDADTKAKFERGLWAFLGLVEDYWDGVATKIGWQGVL